jgi:hypothetical protein
MARRRTSGFGMIGMLAINPILMMLIATAVVAAGVLLYINLNPSTPVATTKKHHHSTTTYAPTPVPTTTTTAAPVVTTTKPRPIKISDGYIKLSDRSVSKRYPLGAYDQLDNIISNGFVTTTSTVNQDMANNAYDTLIKNTSWNERPKYISVFSNGKYSLYITETINTPDPSPDDYTTDTSTEPDYAIGEIAVTYKVPS